MHGAAGLSKLPKKQGACNGRMAEARRCAALTDQSHSALHQPVQSDFISFRHHTYEMPKGSKSIQLKECGPRFEMKLYQVRLAAAAWHREAHVNWPAWNRGEGDRLSRCSCRRKNRAMWLGGIFLSTFSADFWKSPSLARHVMHRPASRPTQIKLGTLDQPHAETEWALRSYTRSAKRSKLAVVEEEEA